MELAIVVAIVAALAGMAFPAYRNHVLRANRIDARAALLALAAAQEQFYLKCSTYTRALDDSQATSCTPENLRIATRIPGGNYRLEVTAADSSGWEAAAVALAGTQQERDITCRTLRLTSTGARSALTSGGAANDLECWRR